MIAIEHVEQSSRRLGRIAIAALSAALLVAVSVLALRHSPSANKVVVLPQSTTTVTCGQTITVSITLGVNLICGSGNGLNVGANGITINLNGHTLTGNTSGVGVRNGLFSGVTIENGSVTGWADGILVDRPTNKITGVRASQNQTGMVVTGSGSTVSGNVIFSNTGPGITVDANNVKVTANVVRQNGADGIDLFAGTGSFIQTNQVENNTGRGILDEGSKTTVTGNISNANGGDGIRSSADDTAAVGTNTANFNGAFGIEASPGGKDIGGNLAKGNTQATQCEDVVCS
jgi:Right handed beta helix region